jgi:hypothetical protein
VSDLLSLPAEPDPGPPPTTIERAFALAAEGRHRSIEDIAAQLKAELRESVDAQLADATIRRELRQVCAEGRKMHSTRPQPVEPMRAREPRD